MKKILILSLALCLVLCSCNAVGTDTDSVSTAAKEALRSDEEYAKMDNTACGWGMKKVQGSKPEIPDSIVKTIEENGAVYLGSKPKTLYLTFDEGYENGYTAKILDVLKSTCTPAAFFITGGYIESEPELVKRMADEGHIVGNHTYKHPSMPQTDNQKLAEDIIHLSEEYRKLTGKEMTYFRPPAGEYSVRTLNLTRDLGLKTVFWSFAYVDWKADDVRGGDYAYNQIMPYLHDGEIILLHAVSPDNAEALERVINDAKAQGYVFESLDNL